MSSTTLPVCPKTGSTSRSLTVHLCLHTVPGNRECAPLFGKQEGHCGGCRMMFPFRNFEIDHIIPRAKGGHDHLDNLQLLCGACNRAKATGTQAKLIAKLRERGQLAA